MHRCLDPAVAQPSKFTYNSTGRLSSRKRERGASDASVLASLRPRAIDSSACGLVGHGRGHSSVRRLMHSNISLSLYKGPAANVVGTAQQQQPAAELKRVFVDSAVRVRSCDSALPFCAMQLSESVCLSVSRGCTSGRCSMCCTEHCIAKGVMPCMMCQAPQQVAHGQRAGRAQWLGLNGMAAAKHPRHSLWRTPQGPASQPGWF